VTCTGISINSIDRHIIRFLSVTVSVKRLIFCYPHRRQNDCDVNAYARWRHLVIYSEPG